MGFGYEKLDVYRLSIGYKEESVPYGRAQDDFDPDESKPQ